MHPRMRILTQTHPSRMLSLPPSLSLSLSFFLSLSLVPLISPSLYLFSPSLLCSLSLLSLLSLFTVSLLTLSSLSSHSLSLHARYLSLSHAHTHTHTRTQEDACTRAPGDVRRVHAHSNGKVRRHAAHIPDAAREEPAAGKCAACTCLMMAKDSYLSDDDCGGFDSVYRCNAALACYLIIK
jgi:hypothetical protein